MPIPVHGIDTLRPLADRLIRRLSLAILPMLVAACATVVAPPAEPPEAIGPPPPPEMPAPVAEPAPTPAVPVERPPRKRPHARNERSVPDPATVPDPVPRYVPLATLANRPYVLFGQQFVPMTERVAFRQRGLASWYGPGFHGQRTANGERYDMYGMTAAHPTLPIPSFVRVTSRDSGRSVVVRVNDRGPYRYGRSIDLSYTAAWKLGFVKQGTGDVDIELITSFPGTVASAVKGVVIDAMDPPRSRASASSWVTDVAGDDWLELGRFTNLAFADALRVHLAAEYEWSVGMLRVVRSGPAFILMAIPEGPLAETLEAPEARAQ